MKTLAILVVLFVTLIISGTVNCTTVTPQILSDQLLMETTPAERTSERGWFVGDADGYVWYYQAKEGELIGQCRYTYIRYNGSEIWKGIFYQQTTDFQFKPFYNTKVNSLAECVEWIEQLSLGGYYL